MELYNRSMQVCRSYYWTRHGASENTNINKASGLNMLVVTLQEMAVKEKKVILLFQMYKVGLAALSPVDMEDFVLLRTNLNWGSAHQNRTSCVNDLNHPPLHEKLL